MFEDFAFAVLDLAKICGLSLIVCGILAICYHVGKFVLNR